MVNEKQAGRIWTVVDGKNQIPFASFEVAVGYADRLVSMGRRVKVIDVCKSTIRVEPLEDVTWVADPETEVNIEPRRRRTFDN